MKTLIVLLMTALLIVGCGGASSTDTGDTSGVDPVTGEPIVDNDNDSVADSVDCDDNDATVYQNIDGYVDSDNDGYGDHDATLESVCSGASIASGYSLNNEDQFSEDSGRYQIASSALIQDGYEGTPRIAVDSNGVKTILYLSDSTTTVVKNDNFEISIGSLSAHNIEVDASGNIVIAGRYSSGMLGAQYDFTNGTDGTVPAVSTGIFAMGITSDGDFDWLSYVEVVNSPEIADVVINGSDLYILGDFNGTADFGDGDVTTSNNDMFVWKLNAADGSYVTAFLYGGAGNDYAEALAVDANGIYISGDYNNEGVLAKVNDAGTESWNVIDGKNGHDVTLLSDGAVVWANSDAAASAAYVTEYNQSTGALVETIKTYTSDYWISLESDSNDDVIIAGYHALASETKTVFASVNNNWEYEATISSSDDSLYQTDIVVYDDVAYIVGITEGTVDVDFTEGTESMTSTHGLFLLAF